MALINLPAKTIVNGDSASSPVGASIMNPLYQAVKTLADARDGGVIAIVPNIGTLMFKFVTGTIPSTANTTLDIPHGVNSNNIICFFGRTAVGDDGYVYLDSQIAVYLITSYVAGEYIRITTSSSALLSKQIKIGILYFV